MKPAVGLAAALTVVSLLAPALADAASIVVVRVTAKGLNIRALPSPRSEVVGYLARGETTIATIGRDDGWLLVRSRTGRTGYISGRFVELVRVVAVDGEPVPSKSAGAGPCGDEELSIEVEIADARLQCDRRVLGAGVASCAAGFSVQAQSRCRDRLYRTLECEAHFTFLREGGEAREASSASATALFVLDEGAGATSLDVEWDAPGGGPPVDGVRLETATCELR